MSDGLLGRNSHLRILVHVFQGSIGFGMLTSLLFLLSLWSLSSLLSWALIMLQKVYLVEQQLQVLRVVSFLLQVQLQVD